MKKFIALLLVAVTVFSFAACGSGSSNSNSGSGSGAEAGNGAEASEKKSILYYCQFIGDFGLNDMGWRAAQKAAEKYDMDLTLVEYGNDTSQAVNSLVDALDGKDYDYVLCMSWYINDAIVERSENGGPWSKHKFILFDTGASYDYSKCDNIYGISFAQNQGSFLVGVYSALMSKTNKVGVCINIDAPITNDFGVGWLAGVKYANENLGTNVDYMYTYLGELTVQGDYESVNVVMDNGCDYVYNVAGSVAMGAMQAAEEKGGVDGGKFIIGCDYDQYGYFAQVGDVPGYQTMVTSMLKNIEICVEKIFDNAEGDATGIEIGNKVYGLADGGVGLVDNDHYRELTPDAVREKIDEIAAKVASGEIEVPSYFDFATYDDFAAYRDA